MFLPIQYDSPHISTLGLQEERRLPSPHSSSICLHFVPVLGVRKGAGRSASNTLLLPFRSVLGSVLLGRHLRIAEYFRGTCMAFSSEIAWLNGTYSRGKGAQDASSESDRPVGLEKGFREQHFPPARGRPRPPQKARSGSSSACLGAPLLLRLPLLLARGEKQKRHNVDSIS